jgi:hypothetical protein
MPEMMTLVMLLAAAVLVMAISLFISHRAFVIERARRQALRRELTALLLRRGPAPKPIEIADLARGNHDEPAQ